DGYPAECKMRTARTPSASYDQTTTNKRESSMGSMMAIKTVPVEGTLPDTEVVRRVLAGERALFEELMRRYNQRVYRTIRGILRNEQEIEDTMQQAYLLAYAHL